MFEKVGVEDLREIFRLIQRAADDRALDSAEGYNEWLDKLNEIK